jgi:hypothetical protein
MSDVTIRKSGIEGKGVFASRDFVKGEIVARLDDSHLFESKELERMPAHERKYTIPYSGKFLVIQPPNRYINHSCDPNTASRNKLDVAIRDIKKGEEITTDYLSTGGTYFSFMCKCGSRSCRGFIRGKFKK